MTNNGLNYRTDSEAGILLVNATKRLNPREIAFARRITSSDEIDRQNLICRVLDLGDATPWIIIRNDDATCVWQAPRRSRDCLRYVRVAMDAHNSSRRLQCWHCQNIYDARDWRDGALSFITRIDSLLLGRLLPVQLPRKHLTWYHATRQDDEALTQRNEVVENKRDRRHTSLTLIVQNHRLFYKST